MTSQKDILDYFENRFGIRKSLFKGFRIYADQKGRIFLCSKGLSAQSSAVSIGMQIARVGNDIKPSTNFLQLFGKHATKNFILFTREQAQAYARGEDIELSGKVNATDRYVLLKYLDFPLACGMLKNKIIKNVLPKARRAKVEFL
jgi:NOL1/NOP2/fmu family ribosome biogenesis protein